MFEYDSQYKACDIVCSDYEKIIGNVQKRKADKERFKKLNILFLADIEQLDQLLEKVKYDFALAREKNINLTKHFQIIVRFGEKARYPINPCHCFLIALKIDTHTGITAVILDSVVPGYLDHLHPFTQHEIPYYFCQTGFQSDKDTCFYFSLHWAINLVQIEQFHENIIENSQSPITDENFPIIERCVRGSSPKESQSPFYHAVHPHCLPARLFKVCQKRHSLEEYAKHNPQAMQTIVSTKHKETLEEYMRTHSGVYIRELSKDFTNIFCTMWYRTSKAKRIKYAKEVIPPDELEDIKLEADDFVCRHPKHKHCIIAQLKSLQFMLEYSLENKNYGWKLQDQNSRDLTGAAHVSLKSMQQLGAALVTKSPEKKLMELLCGKGISAIDAFKAIATEYKIPHIIVNDDQALTLEQDNLQDRWVLRFYSGDGEVTDLLTLHDEDEIKELVEIMLENSLSKLIRYLAEQKIDISSLIKITFNSPATIEVIDGYCSQFDRCILRPVPLKVVH